MSARVCLLAKLLRRGLVGGIYPESAEYRDKLASQLAAGPATVYAGLDATSNSLHVGNLATIVNLLHFQRHGHQVIFLIGDATTRLGDPAGHTRDRQKIEQSVIQDNADAIESSLRRLVCNFNTHFADNKTTGQPAEAPKEPIFVRNSEWFQDENVVDFVGDVFRDVRVGDLLHKKSIRERLETSHGLNMSEFSYQIFQAFDWLELRRRYDCKLQVGGADQGGNIYTGHDLIRRRLKARDSIGLLAPLITSSKTGRKLGKSTENKRAGIWLSEQLTSPFDLYQFFHRTPDSDVEKFLRVFTFYDDLYIDELVRSHLRDPADVWYCQRKLAEHACLLVHGDEGLTVAKRTTETLFPRKQ